jgi:flagellar protein FlbD
MIAVTRLNGRPLLLNDDLIESIEQTPDTVVSLDNGHKVLLRDAPDQLVERIVEFRRAITQRGR